MEKKITRPFFERSPVDCARELIGQIFRWKSAAGIIVETEAYAEHGDEACHTFFRPSARDFVEKNPAGTAYVYLNYGMYWLTNVLCKNPKTGDRGFVLIRALEPTAGIAAMKKRRNRDQLTDLCSGPGKLSQALAITGDDHGKNFAGKIRSGFWENDSDFKIETDRRIGISRSVDLEWRFLAARSPHVSRPKGKV